MEIQDDRTPEQRKTHRFGICMTDSFMSGWGRADGGVSYAVWAFADIKDEYEVDRWVRSRGDAKRVRTVCLDNYRPRGRGHCHIYVAGETQGVVERCKHKGCGIRVSRAGDYSCGNHDEDRPHYDQHDQPRRYRKRSRRTYSGNGG